MADETQQEDRTEAATPRRLQRAREEGQVPVSRELTGFAGLAAVTLALVVVGPGASHDLALRLSVFLARAHELTPRHRGVPAGRPGLAARRGAVRAGGVARRRGGGAGADPLPAERARRCGWISRASARAPA